MPASPVIIEAALNGVTTRGHNPVVPESPAELASDAISCIDAGATIVHTHADNLGAPVADLTRRYADCFQSVLLACPDALLYPTIGLGSTVAERFGHVAALASEGLAHAAAVDPGSVNLGGAGLDGLPPPMEFVYTNTFADIRYAFDLAAQHRIGPSVAIFEPGFLQVVLAYFDAGALPPGTLVKLYFAAGGYLTPGRALWGAPPIREALDLYLAMLGERPVPWAIAVVGGSLFDHRDLVATALERGGHLRVGLEDWADGPTNAEQVARVVGLAREAGRPVASAAETAALLALPRAGEGAERADTDSGT
jgi:3-keto-5-aminohexanoate cleavage enzyme